MRVSRTEAAVANPSVAFLRHQHEGFHSVMLNLFRVCGNTFQLGLLDHLVDLKLIECRPLLNDVLDQTSKYENNRVKFVVKGC